jgi:hypothetical protein
MNLVLVLAPFLLLAAKDAMVPTLRTIHVPAGLKASTSNPELSGIVWCPPLKRYLVVSDDAGKEEEGTKHSPFVLGLDEQGQLDPTPIPIVGVNKVNDPESICIGPANTYFLITSHSLNRSEKIPKPRRQLLHLELSQRTLKVLGKADLTHFEGSKSLLEIAGLPNDARLDIEAIAYHERALFIGLKSPLTKDGRALILRLADPDKAVSAEKIPPQSLSRFLQIPLCSPVHGTLVCQGISDMLFLADGSLVLTANAPKGGPNDGGGSLWYVPSPVAQSKPILLERFPGKKPEGLAYAPGGRELVIVFDTDQKTPSWTQYPIPSPKTLRPTR